MRDDRGEQCIRFRVKKSDHLPDIVREVQTEIESFHSMLEASVIAAQLQDVRISEGDRYLLYMRNLPVKVQEFLQLHPPAPFRTGMPSSVTVNNLIVRQPPFCNDMTCGPTVHKPPTPRVTYAQPPTALLLPCLITPSTASKLKTKGSPCSLNCGIQSWHFEGK